MNMSLLLGSSIRCTWQCHATTGQAQHVSSYPTTYLVLVWRWHTTGHSWWLVWHPEIVPSPLEGTQGVKSGTASLALEAQAEDSLCGQTADREDKNEFYRRLSGKSGKRKHTEMPESATQGPVFVTASQNKKWFWDNHCVSSPDHTLLCYRGYTIIEVLLKSVQTNLMFLHVNPTQGSIFLTPK